MPAMSGSGVHGSGRCDGGACMAQDLLADDLLYGLHREGLRVLSTAAAARLEAGRCTSWSSKSYDWSLLVWTCAQT